MNSSQGPGNEFPYLPCRARGLGTSSHISHAALRSISFSRIMADYRECAERLITTADRLTITNTSPSFETETAASPNQSPKVPALEEHKRIFGFQPPVGPAQTRSYISRGKREAKPYFVPKSKWARNFICLARKVQGTSPTTAERISLSAATILNPGLPSTIQGPWIVLY